MFHICPFRHLLYSPHRSLYFGSVTILLLARNYGAFLTRDACTLGTHYQSTFNINSKRVGSAAGRSSCESNSLAVKKDLGFDYLFIPFGLATLGQWDPSVFTIFKILSRNGDAWAGIGIQKENTALVLVPCLGNPILITYLVIFSVLYTLLYFNFN